MGPVKECANITNQLYDLVKLPIGENDRDENIQKLEVLLEKRGTYLSLIHPPFSPEEEKVGKDIVKKNREIDVYLKKHLTDIQTDIQGVNKKKISMQHYTNPYQSLQSDGIYYDKKN